MTKKIVFVVSRDFDFSIFPFLFFAWRAALFFFLSIFILPPFLLFGFLCVFLPIIPQFVHSTAKQFALPVIFLLFFPLESLFIISGPVSPSVLLPLFVFLLLTLD